MRGATAIVGYAELPTRRQYPGKTMNGLLAEAARDAIDHARIRKEEIDAVAFTKGLDC